VRLRETLLVLFRRRPPAAEAPEPPTLLYPFETYTLLMLAVAVLFLRSQGLPLGWLSVKYLLAPMIRRLPQPLLIGVGLQALYHLLRRRSLKAYLRTVFTWPWLVLWLRIWFACMLWNYVYFWLKVYVPLVNPQLWDAQLWHFDALLHAGVSPSQFLVEATGSSWLVPALDRWYGLWIQTVIWTLSFFTAAPDPALRRSFMLACVAMWTVGAWIYVALPALGPIYAYPEVWQGLSGRMPGAEGGQALLWDNYRKLLRIRQSGLLGPFNPTRGIAAMPSLHVGAHWLFALWSRRAARPLLAFFAVATLLTFLASVLTGWHYAVDGYVALLLAWGSFRFAGWAEPWANCDKPAPAPT
jgi:PAP2 superfamily